MKKGPQSSEKNDYKKLHSYMRVIFFLISSIKTKISFNSIFLNKSLGKCTRLKFKSIFEYLNTERAYKRISHVPF